MCFKQSAPEIVDVFPATPDELDRAVTRRKR